MRTIAVFAAAATAAVLWVAPSFAAPGHSAGTEISQHDRNVIRFFSNHPRLALTPSGQRSLWTILAHVSSQIRSMQSARAAPRTWLSAVAVVGRYFGPDVAGWEKSCSSSEGGWGGFVWFGHYSYAVYGANDTPGGNLQFKGGTFYGIIDKAIAHARALGMYVPDSARSFYDPFGQAIAGAQMIADGRRGEWTGGSC